jgi:adenosine deaminase
MNETANSGDSWYDDVPKVELHLHLEGAIPLPALFELVRKYGGTGEVPDLETLRNKFRYRDFPHFIETWIWKNGWLREYEDFDFIAEAVARRLLERKVRYAEVFFTPSDFKSVGLSTQRIAEAIRTGLNRVPGTEVALIADLCRDRGPESGSANLSMVDEARAFGIIGIGIGGSEQRYPPEPFAPVYDRARELGFRTTAHAGEAAGPESVWGALRSLGVERIGHGTRAAEDPALLEFMAERRIPIEACPLSNLRTGVISRIEDYPIARFLDYGIPVTINTDDPEMFGNSLPEEYRLLEEKLGFSREGLRALILNGISASWLDPSKKEALMEEFVSDPSW